jgi:RHS repeat-associated protein
MSYTLKILARMKWGFTDLHMASAISQRFHPISAGVSRVLLALFLTLSLAPAWADLSPADAQVLAVFGVLPWNSGHDYDPSPFSNFGAIDCPDSWDYKPSDSPYKKATDCAARAFSWPSLSIFREDLGLDSTNSFVPNGLVVFSAGRFLVPRCTVLDSGIFTGIISCSLWSVPAMPSMSVDSVAFNLGPTDGEGDTNCPPCQAGTYVGDPVNAATGNVFESETDYSGASSFRLRLVRYYNSQFTGNGSFGANWTHQWDAKLLITDGFISAIRNNQKTLIFWRNGGITYPTRNVNAQLTAVAGGWDYRNGQDGLEHYDYSGRLLSITNRAGLTQTLSYSADGTLASVSDPFGRTLSFDYDSNKRIIRATDPSGGVYTYSYDAKNNLTGVIYPDKTTRKYTYTSSLYPHALTSIMDENNQPVSTWTYDAIPISPSNGVATSATQSGGVNAVNLQYDFRAGNTQVSDALGSLRSYAYQPLDLGMAVHFEWGILTTKGTQPTSNNQTSAAVQTWAYDTNGNISKYIDFNGNATVYEHDLTRNLETSRTEAFGTPLARTITTQWHADFRLPLSITEPSGVSGINRVTTFTYDAKGNLLSKTVMAGILTRSWSWTYNSQGQPLTSTDPNGNTTAFAYDTTGNLTSVTNALGQVSKIIKYDATGRPLTLQDPNGLITQLAYDPRGRLLSRNTGGETTSYSYDAVGQVLKITHPDASFSAFSYDPAHRLTQISDNLGNKIVYTLDANDNQTKKQVYDPSGTLTRSLSQTFDAVNRLQTSVGAQGQTTTNGYDSNGNLTSVTDPLSKATNRSFDALNRLIASIDPLSGKTQYQFDANDNLAQVTDPRSANTVYTYDGLGNKTQQTSPDTGVITYTYDAAGNVISSTDARGVQTLYSYDALNRLTKKSFTPNIRYGDISGATYQYDQGKYGIGHLTGMTDMSGTTTWLYEIHGRVVQQQQTIGLVTLTTNYQYDATGRLSQLTTPANQIIAYQYNANGQVNAIKVNGVVLFNAAQYQPFGAIASWVWGNGTAYKRSYDLDGRLTKLPLGTDNRSITYDAASRITGQTSDGTVQSVSPNFVTGANAGTTKYSIKPTGNSLLSQTFPNGSVSAMGYDVVGNLLNDSFSSYQYDLGGRLINAGSNSFQEDGLGKRVAKVNLSTGNRYFAYDQAGHLLGEYNAQGLAIQETIWLGDMPVGTVSASTGLLYVYADHLYTPRTVTTQSNRVLWSWVSDPFGNGTPTTSNDDTGNPYQYNLRFPGQYYDQETALHYNMARYYNPVIGRYTQSDPIGLEGGLNTYGYVGGNPLTRVDTFGLEWQFKKWNIQEWNKWWINDKWSIYHGWNTQAVCYDTCSNTYQSVEGHTYQDRPWPINMPLVSAYDPIKSMSPTSGSDVLDDIADLIDATKKASESGTLTGPASLTPKDGQKLCDTLP